jgi:ABC-type transport system involved in multi-copper enzyme maturation permease subunit
VSVGIASGGIGTREGTPAQTALAVTIIENLASGWPNILVLALVTIFTFIISYIIFIKQEAR